MTNPQGNESRRPIFGVITPRDRAAGKPKLTRRDSSTSLRLLGLTSPEQNRGLKRGLVEALPAAGCSQHIIC